MKKVLFIGDAVAPTGFKTVLHNIIGYLPQDSYEIHHLGINYYGDPHDYDWKIYPAVYGGDIWGFSRINSFLNLGLDMIFILNDVWVIDKYLEKLKENEKLPKIAVYFPVDSKELSPQFFKNFDIVTSVNVYTEFARNEVLKVKPDLEVNIIPHGVNTKVFHKIKGKTKRQIKKLVYNTDNEEFLDSFIVLNANRNQPRKRYDLTLEGFSLFAKDKPMNVKLYAHCGLKDMGFDIVRLSYRYGIDNRLIISNTEQGLQKVPEDKLNLIYNATDVGINTSVGEGWGLVSHEHASIGIPQIVPDHSACRELFFDVGLLIPIHLELVNNETMTVSGYVKPEDVAERLELLYTNEKVYKKMSSLSMKKFASEEYTWKYIVDKYWIPIFEEVIDG